MKKKIKAIEYSKTEDSKPMKNRKRELENIIKKCSATELSKKLQKECIHFRQNQSELKIYGGVVNEK